MSVTFERFCIKWVNKKQSWIFVWVFQGLDLSHQTACYLEIFPKSLCKTQFISYASKNKVQSLIFSLCNISIEQTLNSKMGHRQSLFENICKTYSKYWTYLISNVWSESKNISDIIVVASLLCYIFNLFRIFLLEESFVTLVFAVCCCCFLAFICFPPQLFVLLIGIIRLQTCLDGCAKDFLIINLSFAVMDLSSI